MCVCVCVCVRACASVFRARKKSCGIPRTKYLVQSTSYLVLVHSTCSIYIQKWVVHNTTSYLHVYMFSRGTDTHAQHARRAQGRIIICDIINLRTCMYICTYVHVYSRMHTDIRVRACVCTYVHLSLSLLCGSFSSHARAHAAHAGGEVEKDSTEF